MLNREEILSGELKIPVVAAPMFLISGPKLVTACCKNGVIGTFPALNQRTTEGFEEWVIEIKEDLAAWEKETGKKAAPFGVNLIVHHSNPRVQADLMICVKHKVPIIITSLGAVKELVGAVQSYGGMVFHDVIKHRHAEKAHEAGVDGLILVCAGAGGHAGLLNPMPFVQEVKSFFDGIILLSGAMSNGQVIDSGTKDIIYTAAVSGVNANFLRLSLESMGITQELWERKAKVDFGEELDAAEAEAKAWKTIWSAGHGVATIQDNLPVAELIDRMHGEFMEALRRQQALIETYT